MMELELPNGLLITNERCVVMKHRNVAIISDLHIGLESALEAQGLHLPHIQTETMMASLQRIIERYRPQQFIILGDLKHEFSKNLTQEWSEVQKLLGILRQGVEILPQVCRICFSALAAVVESFITGYIHTRISP